MTCSHLETHKGNAFFLLVPVALEISQGALMEGYLRRLLKMPYLPSFSVLYQEPDPLVSQN